MLIQAVYPSQPVNVPSPAYGFDGEMLWGWIIGG